MGTTLIALLRSRDKVVLAHIGDSRAFLVREGKVTQITKDHSFVQNLVDEGRITQQEAQTHPQRSLVTRVLTGDAHDEPDLVVRQGRIGDRYLICSDGLSDYVARDTIDEVLLGVADPGECADRLVALALRAGAPDNVTVVVGDLVDAGRSTAPSTVPEVVGAAAARRSGTRPIPTTPAAKAAALTQQATGGADDDTDDHVTLAEEGPRSRRGLALRLAALAVVAGVVLAGGSYAAYAWSQQQYYLAASGGVVSVYRGVDQTLGPVSLSSEEYATTIAVEDLPPSYQEILERGIEASDRVDADARVGDLRLQAEACRYARANGEVCQTVPSTWTQPTATPTPTPTSTASPSASPSPSGSATASPSATPGRSRTPVTPLPPTTQPPVTS